MSAPTRPDTLRAPGASNDPPTSDIPMLDLAAEVGELWSEIQPAVERVLKSGHFIGGREVEAFEEEVAAYLGVRHAVGLNSGTDALVLGLEALGIGPGDEVITSPFSFFATSEAILRVGATPRFGDVDPRTMNLDPATLEGRITERTRAILPVHLFGLPAEVEPILDVARRHDLAVLEDCAQAFGATHIGKRVGSFGAIGAFSFYPTKNLGAYGDGGLAVTDDDELARRLRSLRNHGSSPADKYRHERLGHNSRLDALQAAILRVKLPKVDAWNERRRALAAGYHDALRESAGVGAPPAFTLPHLHPEHVFHQFTVQVEPNLRPAFERALQEARVAFSRFYPAPLTHQPDGCSFDEAPTALALAERVVSLPLHPWLPQEAFARVRSAAERVA
ncbi:MAG: DegT/DnrJ/EryC1/StrS family aminotransferase [Trueperaceae bacterium]